MRNGNNSNADADCQAVPFELKREDYLPFRRAMNATDRLTAAA